MLIISLCYFSFIFFDLIVFVKNLMFQLTPFHIQTFEPKFKMGYLTPRGILVLKNYLHDLKLNSIWYSLNENLLIINKNNIYMIKEYI